MVNLGEGIDWGILGPVTPPEPTGDERRHREIMAAFGVIIETLAAALERPEPSVHVEGPNLSPILAALQERPALPTLPSPDVLAEQVARRIPDNTRDVATALQAVTAQLQSLGKKVIAASISPSGGSSGHVIVDNMSESVNGMASETTLLDLKRARTDQRVLMDYATRTDGNPVYVGKAVQGTAITAATWQIQRFTYDASNRATDVQVLIGAWDSRATVGWL